MFAFKYKRISTRFTLLLAVVCAGGLISSYAVLSRALTQRVQDDVISRSAILIGLMNSVRFYTTNHVAPLINSAQPNSEQFIPETVPAFSAREVFENLRKSPEYTDFLYKEATLNPTNPRDLADPFETALVGQFRANETLTELSGYRTLNGIETFYDARPFKITNAACLACHDTPEKAPPSLVRTYGPTNGFGWKMGDIIAAQVIYLPAQAVIDTARNVTLLVMAVFLIVFLLAMFSINVMVRRNVVQPIEFMGRIAEKVTQGDMQFTTVEQKQMAQVAERTDEIGQTARVLEKMTSEVRRREEKLNSQVRALRIQVDEARKVKQVAEITESDYFQDLKAKIEILKGRQSPGPATGD